MLVFADYSYQQDDVENIIIDALEAYEEEVYISDYSISKNDINAIITKIIEENAQLFYVNKEYSISCDRITGEVISVEFSFKYRDSELNIKINDFNSRIEMILNEIEETGTDLDIVHSCHDFIVNNYSYDESMGSSDAYNMLLTKKGTCMAYTELYGYLLGKYGIDSTVVNSEQMNHIWNAVELDGEYYNVDVTWDDPIGASGLTTSHKYLVKSDEYFESHDHTDITSDVECSSTIYDSYRWGDETIFSRAESASNIFEFFYEFLPLTILIFIILILAAIIIGLISKAHTRKKDRNNLYPPYY